MWFHPPPARENRRRNGHFRPSFATPTPTLPFLFPCDYNPFSRIISGVQALSRCHGGALESNMSVMSFNGSGDAGRHSRGKITTTSIQEKKRNGERITCLTAYDYSSARLIDEAGIDMILVGDSLGMVVLGYDNTMAVTMEEMLHHTRAVRRAVKSALVIADMPFGSYHLNATDAVNNAVRFVKEAGAEAVKIEGGENRAELVHRLLDAQVPVMGH